MKREVFNSITLGMRNQKLVHLETLANITSSGYPNSLNDNQGARKAEKQKWKTLQLEKEIGMT